MPLNHNKVYEALNGFKVMDGTIEGPIYTGGINSPIGIDFPVGTFYIQNINTGPIVWKKFNTGINDWTRQISIDFYQKIVDNLETLTLSTTVWSTKLTLITPNLPLGDYKIEFNYKWRNLLANRSQDTRIQNNSLDVLTWVGFNPSVLESSLQSGILYLDSISGIQTITLQFKVLTTATTTFMSNAKMEFKRIS